MRNYITLIKIKKSLAYLCLVILTILTGKIYSQNVGINSTGIAADPSAALDVASSNKGLLIPRVALTAKNSPLPITSPLVSLMVYNTATAGAIPNNVVPGYYYWDGANWVGLASSGASWSLLGNAGTSAGTNFIGTTDAQDLVIKTNNTEKMRVLSNGNVGIGTNAPSSLLTIMPSTVDLQEATGLDLKYRYVPDPVGTYRYWMLNNVNSLGMAIGDAPGLLFTNGNTYLRSLIVNQDGLSFFTNGTTNSNATEKMRILSNGQIGIGTTIPNTGSILDIVGATKVPDHGTLIHNDPVVTGLPATDGFRMKYDNHFFAFNVDALVFEKTDGNDPNPDGGIAFTNTGQTGTEVTSMVIRGDGKVGIGISAPSEKLNVSGKLLLENGFSATNAALVYKNQTDYLYIGPQSGTSTDGAGISLSGSTNATIGNPGGIKFHVSGLSPAVTINNSGNVGIGTNSPACKLDVNGGWASINNDATNGVLGLINLTGKNTAAVEPNKKQWTIYNMNEYGSMKGLVFWEYYDRNNNGSFCDDGPTDCNSRMIIQNGTGYVGIATTAPTSNLSVNGTADKVGGGAWAVFSDKRVKKNINSYNKGLDYILKINPVSFQYNGKGGYQADGKTYVGVIAQEIEEVLPSTVAKVKTADFEDQRIFDASELTFTLINAVKELQEQITALKKENSDLKKSANRIDELEAKVEQLLKTNYQDANKTTSK